ncbi:MAG: hypothetical protein ACXV3V_02025 [Actinomycetes bacterium]
MELPVSSAVVAVEDTDTGRRTVLRFVCPVCQVARSNELTKQAARLLAVADVPIDATAVIPDVTRLSDRR